MGIDEQDKFSKYTKGNQIDIYKLSTTNTIVIVFSVTQIICEGLQQMSVFQSVISANCQYDSLH